MNYKLNLVLLWVLGLMVVVGAGFFAWQYKSNELAVQSPQDISESLKPDKTLPTVQITKDEILNGAYSTELPDGTTREVTYKDGAATLPVQYEQDNSESHIDKDSIIITDLDKDGTSEVIFNESGSYYNLGAYTVQSWQNLEIAHKIKDKFAIISQATIEGATIGEGTQDSFATVQSVSAKDNILTLNIKRETGCSNLPAKEVVQSYKFENNKLTRIDQKETEGDVDIKIISPAKDNIWKIGEPHKIVLSQPWPFEDNCNNLIEVQGGSSYPDAANKDGALIILKKGQSEYPWDGEHVYGFKKDINNYGVYSLEPGAYNLYIESYVTDGPGRAYIQGSSFQLAK